MLTGTGGIDFGVIGAILLTLAALYLASALLSYLQGWLMSGVATKISYSMRRDISNKIDKLPLSYFDRVQSGEVLSRITNDVDTVTQTLNQSLSQIVTNVAALIGVLVMMLTISPVMTLVALCILPVSVLIVSQVVRRSQPFFPPPAGDAGPCERPRGGDVRRPRDPDRLQRPAGEHRDL